MANVKGLSVTADLIAGNPDKTFFVSSAPHYENVPSLRDPEKPIEKLVVPVRLSMEITDSEMDYYPNKTSIRMMTALFGFNMDKWVGHKFEWGVAQQNIAGNMKNVLFVAAKRFNDVLPSEQH